MVVEKSPGRKLFNPPTLLQDWDTDAEELSSKYWELFLDLLLVAASAAIADQLAANPTYAGILEFVTLYLVVVNSYMYYTPAFTTRFEDSSLVHYGMLFPYFLGISICTVNASFQTARSFCIGALMQRIVLVCMVGSVAYHIQRARVFGLQFIFATFISTAILAIGVWYPSTAVTCLYIVAIVETLIVGSIIRFLRKEDMIPINIEHTKDRLGTMVLIMLGETVVSVSIQYRLLQKGSILIMERYYWTTGYSFLLIFTFTLLYFHMQPSPSTNGFHRSRLRGLLLLQSHKLLGMTLLSIGVAVRMMIQASCDGTELTAFARGLTGISVGLSIGLLFVIRLLHYGFLGPRPYPRRILIVLDSWWGVFVVATTLPFGLIALKIRDPVYSAGIHASISTALCVIESAFTHILEDVIMDFQKNQEDEANRSSESPSDDVMANEVASLVPAVEPEVLAFGQYGTTVE